MMAVAETALLSGLPVRLDRIPIAILYGVIYILFSYAYMLRWHSQGPAFLYWFLDTTFHGHTIALYVLLFVLFVSYGAFCGVGYISAKVGEMLSSSDDEMVEFGGRLAFAVALCTLVCRFRD